MRTLFFGLLFMVAWTMEAANSTESDHPPQSWKSQMGRGSLILKGKDGQVELSDVQVDLREFSGQIDLRIQFGFAGARSKPSELARTLAKQWTNFEHPMAVVEMSGKTAKKMVGHSGYISLGSKRTPFKLHELTLSRADKHPLATSRLERKLELVGAIESSGAAPAAGNGNWTIRLDAWLEK